MGIIRQQTISGTIFTYLGVIIGFVTTALIFPKYLTTEQIGLLSIFLSYSYIFAQLATLGTGRVTVVMFPFFRDREKNHHGFFFAMGMIALAGLVLALAVFFLIRPWLVQNANDSSQLLAENINYLIPLIVISMAYLVFDTFYKTLFNAIRGIILKEFIQRMFILVFVMFFVIKWITFQQFIPLFILALGIPPLVLMVSLMRHKEFVFKPFSSDLLKEYRPRIVSIGIYGIAIGFSGMVILNIDRIMVERLMGLGPTGIYTTMAYFATLIIIPSRALMKISDPVISKFWKDNNLEGLQDNYYRSSLNQFIFGALLFIGIIGNIGNINRILPPEFSQGNWVVFFIGLAFLSDMASGTSNYILANSKYFKYQTYFILILVILIIATNYLLIPVWAITGAAVATFISKVLNNMMRYLLIYRKFGLQPYNIKFLFTMLISLIAFLPGYMIPEISNLYLDIFLRSAVIGGIFIILVIAFRVSPDVNERYKWLLRKFRDRK